MSSPVRDGYAELIITPDVQLLSELAHVNGTPLFMDPLFRRRARRVEPRVQSFRARFLHRARTARHRDVLEAEELVLALLRATLQSTETRQVPNGTSTSRLIRRTKEYLEGNLSNRILLSDVARETGASPAYLTDLFRRVEGVSLHRYLTQLRLARALVQLPHATDLTALALDLGFSSHSHFTHLFRRAFGCTPSQFREMTRREMPPHAGVART
jgi:AraC family transcriptional regulator